MTRIETTKPAAVFPAASAPASAGGGGTAKPARKRELTGRHVLAIVISAFAVIIGVNLTLAWQAITTFPGVDVANSYVASQNFDKRRAAQEALGWELEHSYQAGRLELAIRDAAGQPVWVEGLEVLIGRTTIARDDITPQFMPLGDVYVAKVDLAPGDWMMKIRAHSQDGVLFERRDDFFVRN